VILSRNVTALPWFDVGRAQISAQEEQFMSTQQRLTVIQNLGLVDRVVRTLIGWGLIAAAAADVLSGQQVSWHPYAILFAVYPILTAIVGYDPFYSAAHTKSCDLSERNRCGTFPFEVSAALGHQPRCASEFDCHLEPGEQNKRN
jgi:hypothetical protein